MSELKIPDDNASVFVKCMVDDGTKISCDEISKMITAADKKNIDGRIIRFTSGKTEKLDWNPILNLTQGFFQQSELKIMCLVDNVSGVFEAKTKLGVSTICFVNFKGAKRKSASFFFLEEDIDQLGEKIALDSETLIGNLYAGGESLENVTLLFPFNNEDEKREFKKHFNFSRPYNIIGFLIDVPRKSRTKSNANIVDKIVIVSEYSLHEEDFSPLKKLIPEIKCINDLSLVWDFDNDISIYSELETAILLGNVFYYEYGVPALHITLCGSQRTARKSTWLNIISSITGDDVHRCEGSTVKGLVPSFFDKIDPGAILGSKFVFLGDEFFRTPEQSAQESSSYVKMRQFLVHMMGLFNKTEATFDSGKGKGTFLFTKSFFSTDNMKSSNELKQLFENDPAPLRRFNFLLVSEETEQRGESIIGDYGDLEIKELTLERFKKRGFNWKKLYMLFKFMRELVPSVKYDRQRTRKIFLDVIEKIKPDNALLPTPKLEAWRDLQNGMDDAMKACVKTAVILDKLVAWNDPENLPNSKLFIADESDYILAEQMFERIVFDKVKVVQGRVSEESGIVRFSGKTRW